MEKKRTIKYFENKIEKQYLDFLQILLEKTPEEEEYEYELEQKIYYNKLYKTLMAAMVDNTSEQERKNIRNQKEQLKRDCKKIILILSMIKQYGDPRIATLFSFMIL